MIEVLEPASAGCCIEGLVGKFAGRLLMRTAAFALLVGALGSGCASSRPFIIHEVSPGIFEGRKPTSDADFEALRARGVRTILSLETLPWDIWPERREARKLGLGFRNVPILASPLPPSDKRVKEGLLVLSRRSLQPVFIHCYLGRDRDTFLIALYRVYFEDWTPADAWEETLRSGFRVRATLWGFTTYYWHHCQKPEWVLRARARLPK